MVWGGALANGLQMVPGAGGPGPGPGPRAPEPGTQARAIALPKDGVHYDPFIFSGVISGPNFEDFWTDFNEN